MRTPVKTSFVLLLALSASPSMLARPELDAAPASGIAPGTVRLGGHVLPALARASARPPSAVPRDGDTSPDDDPLTLTIVLRRDDEDGFQRFLAKLGDVRLSPVEVSDRFGPSREAYAAVVRHLETAGFTVVAGSANRLTLVVAGTRGLAERAFGVRISDYELSGRRFFANDRDPELPDAVGRHVLAVVGLSNLARPHPNTMPTNDDYQNCVDNGAQKCLYDYALGQAARYVQLPKSCIEFIIAAIKGQSTAGIKGIQCAADELNVVAAFAANPVASAVREETRLRPETSGPVRPTGTGQKIGLLEFDSFHTSDVADFLALSGLPSTLLSHVSEVKVNGGAPIGASEAEVLLDVDVALSLAPSASVVVYDAPFAGGGTFQALFNQMVNDGVTVISNSWSYCEDQTTLADVQSIDAIFQAAAASHISVFNASGDSGGTCLDGSTNVAGVPATCPHATAVGGASPLFGTGKLHDTEGWWDGTLAIPPTGRGGFGTSRFFPRPAYQNGHTTSTGRSVPDVVANADPRTTGVMICQADAGGCPSGLLYGGSSLAAPIWAALTALLNESHGSNLGELNPLLYPLSATNAFRAPGSLGSDFAHAGLGSPNHDALHLGLLGSAPGAPSAAVSQAVAYRTEIPADGATPARIAVILMDAQGHTVAGKTVHLTASGGSHATIQTGATPTNPDNGAVVFSVVDSTIENVTFTAHDDTDGFAVTQMATVSFVAPPAAAGGIEADPGTVPANGTSFTVITVTLQDAQGHGTPNKVVTLAQGAERSHVTGPSPTLTDANGQVTFQATDLFQEVVTYTANDVTDGDLPVPGSAMVSFVGATGSSCPIGPETPAAGYLVSSVATGFVVDPNCVGASGTAWDPAGNLYALDYGDYNLYKFPPFTSDGAANAGTRVTAVPYAAGSCPHGLAFGKDGQHLYLARQFCGNAGDVVEVSTTDGHIIRNVATAGSVPCATGLATDPLTGDLFATTPCPFGGSNNIYRISNPDSATPGPPTVYASPGRAAGINFTADGTLWTEGYDIGLGTGSIVKISGTNDSSPGTVTVITAAPSSGGGVLPAFNSAAPGTPPFLFVSTTGAGGVEKVDLTGTPTTSPVTTGGSGLLFVNAGPDGCAYVSNGDRVERISAADGSCTFGASAAAPSLSLSPGVLAATQGVSQTFTATFRNVGIPVSTPVLFQVSGTNPRFGLGRTDTHGVATYAYAGKLAGADRILATAQVSAASFTSNAANVTWQPGKHATFVDLNPSPGGGLVGGAVALKASLSDIGVSPAVALVGASIHFTLGALACDAVPSGGGVATCAVIPTSAGAKTLTATYAGDGSHLASSASQDFEVVGVLRGDANGNGTRDVADVFYLINALFAGGPPPATTCRGDVDGNGIVDVNDVFYLINFLFAGGPPPPVC
jgi:hypothetical protein